MTESKICHYKPCSKVFYRYPGAYQWRATKYCSDHCRMLDSAKRQHEKYKSITHRDYANTKPRMNPEFKNPRFWDKMLTSKL